MPQRGYPRIAGSMTLRHAPRWQACKLQQTNIQQALVVPGSKPPRPLFAKQPVQQHAWTLRQPACDCLVSGPAGASLTAIFLHCSLLLCLPNTLLQVAAGVNGAAGRQMISDNDLFRPAAAGKPKTSLRVGMGQPKRVSALQAADGACPCV